MFIVLLKRELMLAVRRRRELANPLIFFVLVASLFPLGITPDPQLLQTIAPGVIWVAALLASLLGAEGLFHSDYQDGSMEQLMLIPDSEWKLVMSKVCAHWLTSGLPLTIIAPLIAYLLHLPIDGYVCLLITLLLATPVLSFFAAIGMALTLGLRTGGVLVPLLILPFYVPVLVFATAAVGAAVEGLPTNGYYALLGAALILTILFAPFAISASLKVSMR